MSEEKAYDTAIDALAGNLSKDIEKTLSDLLDEYDTQQLLGPLTPEVAASRLAWATFHSTGRKMLLLDGNPIMEFAPLEVDTVVENGALYLKATQKFRRMDG